MDKSEILGPLDLLIEYIESGGAPPAIGTPLEQANALYVMQSRRLRREERRAPYRSKSPAIDRLRGHK